MPSAEFFRDLDLIEYSRMELIDRYKSNLPLTYQQAKDAVRSIEAMERGWVPPELREIRSQPMNVEINPFNAAPLLDCPPPDPTRKAAGSVTFGTTLSTSQVDWCRKHDWFYLSVGGVVIVTDDFTYKGQSYSEKIVWGGTFEELRAWAGY